MNFVRGQFVEFTVKDWTGYPMFMEGIVMFIDGQFLLIMHTYKGQNGKEYACTYTVNQSLCKIICNNTDKGIIVLQKHNWKDLI